jgi:hypothetical protein
MELLKIGTKVFDIRYGWGEITSVDIKLIYSYEVSFEKITNRYDLEGKYLDTDCNATLSLTEYDLINGGFTTLSDYGKPKKFDVGYFWDDEGDHDLIYSQLIEIKDGKYTNSAFNEWDHFSKEVPEWFTKRIKNNN